MKKTYNVTITTRRGYPMPDAERIRSAVFGAGTSYEAINDVKVNESETPPKAKLKVDYASPLYAIGRLSPNTGNAWLLIDFFNTERKAYNAKGKCEKNTDGIRMFADDKFAVFTFCPSLNIWKML